MSLYYFYILDEDGRTAAHRERLCPDDSAAVEMALSLSGGRSVDIWTDDRCVAQFVQSNETVLRC
jgi:hypothetical protein